MTGVDRLSDEHQGLITALNENVRQFNVFLDAAGYSEYEQETLGPYLGDFTKSEVREDVRQHRDRFQTACDAIQHDAEEEERGDVLAGLREWRNAMMERYYRLLESM